MSWAAEALCLGRRSRVSSNTGPQWEGARVDRRNGDDEERRRKTLKRRTGSVIGDALITWRASEGKQDRRAILEFEGQKVGRDSPQFHGRALSGSCNDPHPATFGAHDSTSRAGDQDAAVRVC